MSFDELDGVLVIGTVPSRLLAQRALANRTILSDLLRWMYTSYVRSHTFNEMCPCWVAQIMTGMCPEIEDATVLVNYPRVSYHSATRLLVDSDPRNLSTNIQKPVSLR